MRLATIKNNYREVASIFTDKGAIPMDVINRELKHNWPLEMQEIIWSNKIEDMNLWYRSRGEKQLSSIENGVIAKEDIVLAPLLRHPRKIWGIGLNYRDHAADLLEQSPTSEPASFMKPDTAIIGSGEPIKIPQLSQKTTGEAELGIVFGKQCRDISRENWREVICGFISIIDMTAEDILRRNPRNLTQSKSFDSFISLGAILVTPDEVPDVNKLCVKTVINGEIHAQNQVANMTFSPDFLVSYHSSIMTLLPGDILSTGTPGAAHIQDGDIVECHIDGFEPLINPVIDLKRFNS